MTSLRHDDFHGTDEQAIAAFNHSDGGARWLATPFPRAELGFAAVILVGGVALSISGWGHYGWASVGFAAFFVALAALMAAPSIWTMRHRDAAAKRLGVDRAYNQARWRKHPVGVTVGVLVAGFVNGFARWNHHGVGARLVAGAVSAGLCLLIAGVFLWRARHHVPPTAS